MICFNGITVYVCVYFMSPIFRFLSMFIDLCATYLLLSWQNNHLVTSPTYLFMLLYMYVTSVMYQVWQFNFQF